MRSLNKLQNTKSMKVTPGQNAAQPSEPTPSSPQSPKPKKNSFINRQDKANADNEAMKKPVVIDKPSKKSKKEIAEEVKNAIPALEKRIEEHNANKAEVEAKIKEICAAIREAADNLEEHLNNVLQQSFTAEDERLQKSLEKLKDLSTNEEISEKNKEKEFSELRASLCGVQKYELIQPCDSSSSSGDGDVKRWASETLMTQFKMTSDQSLSEDALIEWTPQIVEVLETGPNEVCVRIGFYGEADVKGVEYKIEMWNGVEGENCIRSSQTVGGSHKAYVEWRLRGEEECRVRGRAIRRGLFGEKCLTGWSEWKTFTVPKKHKNRGMYGVGLVWNRKEEGESYNVIDTTVSDVIYSGDKTYVLLPEYTRGHKLRIIGSKDNNRWEEVVQVKKIKKGDNLLKDLRIFHYDKNVCNQVLDKINDVIKISEDARTKIVHDGLFDVVFNTIRSHINDADICRHGLRIIGNIVSENPDNQRLARESGCIELIKEIIKQHNDSPIVCQTGFDVISSVVYDNPENQRLAGESEYITLIKCIIEQYSDHAVVCQKGLLALSFIVFRQPEIQKLAGEAKCIELAKDVIKGFNENPDVCQAGLGAICEITFKDEEIQKQTGKSKYIKFIRDTIKKHIDNAGVCQFGLRAIRSIVTGNHDNQMRAGEAKCVGLIGTVIKNHKNNANICRNGLLAFGNLALDNAENQKLACESGSVELINETIKYYINEPLMCENGISTIGIISRNNYDARKVVGESGSIALIKDVLKQYTNKADVCQAALYAICEIVSDVPDNQNIVGEFGLIETIKSAIKQNITNPGVCQNGFAAIGNIVYGNPANMKRGCEAGCIDLIFETVDKYKDKRSIAEWCCRCLIRLLAVKETHEKWCTPNVIKKVEECSARFKDSKFIAKSLSCLKRETDPRVEEATKETKCAKKTTACGKEGCRREKLGLLCLECAAPQKCFVCLECQGSKVCCEKCRSKKHDGHKGVEFFDLITYC